jgi:hypothetical protein
MQRKVAARRARRFPQERGSMGATWRRIDHLYRRVSMATASDHLPYDRAMARKRASEFGRLARMATQ